MVEQITTNTAEGSNNWTRRTFMNALGAGGLAASASTASAETVECTDDTSTDGSEINVEALNEVIARLNGAADALEFPARRIGSLPRGAQHGATHWGIHFETEQAIHIGIATVDADESGVFTAVIGQYDGNSQFDPVHERDIRVDAGLNEIDLDMVVEPGEYLLTRDGEFPLRRGGWGGWESQSRDGLELKGGSKPGDYTDNRYWYYYFDLHVAAHEDAHL